MRANTPPVENPANGQLNEEPAPLRWLDRLTAYRQWIVIAFTLVVFVLGLLACWHLLRELDPDALRAAVRNVPGSSLLLALGATLLSYIAYVGYEWSGCRFAGVHLPLRRMALGSFCASGIGNAVGLSMLTGGSVRFRLYGRDKLGAGDIARITLFASLALGSALPLLAALAALSAPAAASLALGLPESLVITLATAVLLAGALLIVWISRRRAPQAPVPGCIDIPLGNRSVRLPGLRLSALQLLITLVDVCAAACVLYVLLPDAPPLGAFLLVYMLALAAGVLSHVPGGVGVFEAVLLAAFAGQLGLTGTSGPGLALKSEAIGLATLFPYTTLFRSDRKSVV